jgi:hypothetical protein
MDGSRQHAWSFWHLSAAFKARTSKHPQQASNQLIQRTVRQLENFVLEISHTSDRPVMSSDCQSAEKGPATRLCQLDLGLARRT